MRKLTDILNALHTRHDEIGIDDFPNSNMRLTKKLDANLQIIRQIFGESNDVNLRTFSFHQTKTRAAVIFIDGLVDAERLSIDIIKPIMYGSKSEETPPPTLRSFQDVSSYYMIAGEIKENETFGALTNGVLNGDAVLIVDGLCGLLTINAKGYKMRSIEDPQTESVLRGPREGFIENARTNTALLRRKIKDPNLMCESVIVGNKTHTAVTLMYLKNVANESLLSELRVRLEKICTDAILDSGYIEQFIVDPGSPFFSTIASSEKPDAVAGKILEGRVAVIVDGSPYVLTLPTFFVETFHSAEDYYIAPIYASALRMVRFFAFFISLLALPLYVALATYHQELIPTELLMTMAIAEGDTPFPAVVEAFIMIIVFEILKEAGIRLPRPAGQAVSMVGAIIIGESAVSAGIIGAPMVIAVAITAVAAFAVPAQANASMLLRLIFLALAGSFGGFGLTIGLISLVFHLSSLTSFGVPYLSPYAPFTLPDTKDALMRFPLRMLLTRPVHLSKRNPRRQRVQPKKGGKA